jgi:hypothetical protein
MDTKQYLLLKQKRLHHGYFYAAELPAYKLNLYIHVCDINEFKTCLCTLPVILNDVAHFDGIAKGMFKDTFPIPEAVLTIQNPDYLDYYRNRGFDLTYSLPEGSTYVRACFSKEVIPVEATFGNF